MKTLNFKEAKRLLLKYKIPFCRTELVVSEKEALRIAKKIGYPVVLKVSSTVVLHKTDLGLVKPDIKNREELKQAWDDIFKLTKKIKGNTEGMLVQKMIFGSEVIVGMKRDLQFGPVLVFGLGGIFVEVLKDVSFRIVPVKKTEALKMIKGTKGSKILEGFRNQKPSDIKKIADIIVSLSKLSLTEKYIKEVDFNPIIASEKQALVVDARFLI